VQGSSGELIIRVVEIKGRCPVYQVGDIITLRQGYILDPAASAPVCLHSLASILPYYVALFRGVRPKDLGLARNEGDVAYVQCLDPCDLTGGGTVRFEIRKRGRS